MIDIKDISGKILKSVIETTDCKKYEELMSLCYISLSWDDENNIQLPAVLILNTMVKNTV